MGYEGRLFDQPRQPVAVGYDEEAYLKTTAAPGRRIIEEVEKRIRDLGLEVSRGLTLTEAVEEARRCLHCDRNQPGERNPSGSAGRSADRSDAMRCMMNRDKILKKYSPTSATTCWPSCTTCRTASEQHYLSDEDLRAAAEYLGLPISFVHGVATFYTMYSLKPRGRYLIRICQSPPCHLMGATDVARELMRLLGIGFGETTPTSCSPWR